MAKLVTSRWLENTFFTFEEMLLVRKKVGHSLYLKSISGDLYIIFCKFIGLVALEEKADDERNIDRVLHKCLAFMNTSFAASEIINKAQCKSVHRS